MTGFLVTRLGISTTLILNGALAVVLQIWFIRGAFFSKIKSVKFLELPMKETGF